MSTTVSLPARCQSSVLSPVSVKRLVHLVVMELPGEHLENKTDARFVLYLVNSN